MTVLLAMAWTVGAATLTAQDHIGLARGTVAEAVVVEDLDGEPFDLGDLVGQRPVLLQFWATWCPDCERLFPHMKAMHAAYGDDVAFVAVAVAVNQSKRRIRRHLERDPLPFHVVWDTRGRATRAFMAPTTSYVVILDASGTVVYTGVGSEQDLKPGIEAALSR
jgi:thiol-disulfide isomerase/thioredoxin